MALLNEIGALNIELTSSAWKVYPSASSWCPRPRIDTLTLESTLSVPSWRPWPQIGTSASNWCPWPQVGALGLELTFLALGIFFFIFIFFKFGFFIIVSLFGRIFWSFWYHWDPGVFLLRILMFVPWICSICSIYSDFCSIACFRASFFFSRMRAPILQINYLALSKKFKRNIFLYVTSTHKNFKI